MLFLPSFVFLTGTWIGISFGRFSFSSGGVNLILMQIIISILLKFLI